ncbi:MAG: sulfatase-like hydrolase/transferase, partial [Candidatus Sumerlaeota bacterium]
MSNGKNFIIITSDELRGDTPGFTGNPDCKTPNLDNFAESGVIFDNHFTVHGKCMPSRIAMMDGRYSHTDGYRTVNKTNLMPAEYPDLMKTLRAEGYEIAKFGHNHVWDDYENEVHYHSFSPEFHDMAK